MTQKLSFSMRGVPENWMNSQGNQRGAFFAQRKRYYEWIQATIDLGSLAREKAGWPRAEMDSPCRSVQIHQIRHGELDEDGLYTSLKPILDGLKASLWRRSTDQGHYLNEMEKYSGAGIIYDDKAKYCQLLPATQEVVARRHDLITTITVEILE